jgi:predicted  nucleic acid-binding Zn-ribbon protein
VYTEGSVCVQEGSAAAEAESEQLRPALQDLKQQMEQLVGALTQSKVDLAASKTEMANAQRNFEHSLECASLTFMLVAVLVSPYERILHQSDPVQRLEFE